MSVYTNPLPHLNSSVEVLQKLGPRHLRAIIKGTHVYTVPPETCSCGPGWNCFAGEPPSISDLIFNDQLSELRKRAKTAMIRAHGSLELPTPTRHHKRAEKKQGKKSFSRYH